MARVFISYKRADKEKVFPLKDKIEATIGESCWIDMDGIESDAQFANVIMHAIDEASVFLFMYSKNHSQIDDYEKDWTVREITYAQEEKKRIVFINIDGTPLTKWFKFMFGLKQQVDASNPQAFEKLLNDICKWLGISKPKPQLKPEPKIKPKLQPKKKINIDWLKLKNILLFCVGIVAAVLIIIYCFPEKEKSHKKGVQQQTAVTSTKQSDGVKEQGEAFLRENAQRSSVITTQSGLQYEIIHHGKGKKPTINSTVKVHYEGTLIDGSVFDSSFQRGEPIDFPLNAVIKGWQEGLQLMPVGSKYILYIPYQLGYGDQAAGSVIPPYSTLIFTVELLEVK